MPSKKSSNYYMGNNYKNTAMTVSIVLGLEAPERQDLFGLLRAYGVSDALRGKVHDLAPDAITAAVLKDLRKRAKAVPLKSGPKAKGKAAAPKVPPKAGRFLSDVASDLFLANLDADAWGWISESPFEGLGFWADFDDAVRFLIIYTSPEAHFLDAMAREPIETLDPRREMASWVAFHRAALALSARHPGRCLFVNAENLRQRPGDVAAALQAAGIVDPVGPETPAFATRAHSDAGHIARTLARQALLGVADMTGVYDELEPLDVLGGCPELPAADVDQQIDELRWQNQKQRTLRQEMAQAAQEARQKLEAMQAEKTVAAGELTKAKQQLEALQAEKAGVAGELATVKQQLGKVEAAAKQKLEALQAEKAGAACELTKVKQLLETLQAEKAGAAGELARLKQQLLQEQGEFKQQLHQIQAEKGQLQHELQLLAQENLEGPTKDSLKEENELLLAQLHEVQEELEYYAREALQLRENHLKNNKNSSENQLLNYWSNNQPEEIWIDIRRPISGESWYEPELSGRWTGPLADSTLNLPPLGSGAYVAEIEVLDAMSVDILESAEAYFRNQKCNRQISSMAGGAGYPVLLRFEFIVNDDASENDFKLSLSVNRTVSPAESGAQDSRSLGLFIRSLCVIRLS